MARFNLFTCAMARQLAVAQWLADIVVAVAQWLADILVAAVSQWLDDILVAVAQSPQWLA